MRKHYLDLKVKLSNLCISNINEFNILDFADYVNDFVNTI